MVWHVDYRFDSFVPALALPKIAPKWFTLFPYRHGHPLHDVSVYGVRQHYQVHGSGLSIGVPSPPHMAEAEIILKKVHY